MNVILKQDVKHLGFSGDIVEVAIGYARNFLIPNRLATVATPAEQKQAEQVRAERVAKKDEIMQNAEKIAKDLDGKTVSFTKKVSSGNKLFGGISEIDVAEAVKEQLKIEIDKSQIKIDGGHIKTIGEHKVDIHLFEGKHLQITAEVKSE
jgi:large subunit ribosomal protein L9